MKLKLKYFTILGIIGCVISIVLPRFARDIILLTSYVDYERLLTFNALFFTIVFAGYYFLQRAKTITKILSLIALIISAVSMIIRLISVPALPYVVLHAGIVYMYPLSWIAFFLGFFLNKGVSNTIRYLSLSSSILALVSIIISVPTATGDSLISAASYLVALVTLTLMLRLQIINANRTEEKHEQR